MTSGSARANERLADLLRTGHSRAAAAGLATVRWRLYDAAEQEELITLLHAYLWDTAVPFDDEWHRSPGRIVTLWAEVLHLDDTDRKSLRDLRSRLVKELTDRGLAYRAEPQSVPLLVRPYTGSQPPPVHRGDPRDAGADATISIGAWGAGYGDAEKNHLVEMAAEKVVTDRYARDGWHVERVAHLNLGWDLTATRNAPEKGELHVEVKGVSGVLPSILLTSNEFHRAVDDPDWILAIVTGALSTTPDLLEVAGKAVVDAAAPSVYRVSLID